MGATGSTATVEIDQLTQWEVQIERLIRSKGGTVSAKEFQRALNIIFHDVEAEHYDDLHAEMWDSLGPIYERLATVVSHSLQQRNNNTLVDVGCGTGLATEFLLQTSLKTAIVRCTMVDTSGEMLNRCRKRSLRWPVQINFIHGQLDLVSDSSADLAVTCSVLHHIPDLSSFCSEVERVLKPGGFFLHIHDPRQGAAKSPVVAERAARLDAARSRRRLRKLLSPSQLLHATSIRVRRIFGLEKGEAYLEEVNRRLIVEELVKKPLAPREIWSVTDLRVGDLPYAASDGVGMDELAEALPHCQRLLDCTYCFFGVLPSQLPPKLAAEEKRLFHENSDEGAYMAGLWRRGD